MYFKTHAALCSTEGSFVRRIIHFNNSKQWQAQWYLHQATPRHNIKRCKNKDFLLPRRNVFVYKTAFMKNCLCFHFMYSSPKHSATVVTFVLNEDLHDIYFHEAQYNQRINQLNSRNRNEITLFNESGDALGKKWMLVPQLGFYVWE